MLLSILWSLTLAHASPVTDEIEPGPASEPAPLDVNSFEVQRLVSWARIYGYLRWFHPSDALSEIDMNSLACLGAARVTEATDPEELTATIRQIFDPLAPTARAWVTESGPPDTWVPTPIEGTRPIAWMHHGVGIDTVSLYSSVRTGRVRALPPYGSYRGHIHRSMNAAGLEGLPFRYTAQMQVRDGEAQLWLSTVGGDGQKLETDPVRHSEGSEWTAYALSGTIPTDAEQLKFGATVTNGTIWVDQFQLEVDREGTWTPVPFDNGSFENETDGWTTSSGGYLYAEIDGTEGTGIQVAQEHIAITPKFERVPEFGTVTTADFAAGVSVSIPLVLLEDDNGTLPRIDSSALATEIEAAPCSDPEALPTRAAAVAIAWNIHQHFHPYLDVVDADWNEALPEAMLGALQAQDKAEFHRVLERLVARLADGHGWVGGSPHPTGRVALEFDWLADEIVITFSEEEGISVGDVLTRFAGEDSIELHAAELPYTSGSPQYATHSILTMLPWGSRGESIEIEVRQPSGELATVQTSYDWMAAKPEPTRPAIDILDDGVIVVDLTRVDWAELKRERRKLARAPGVVIDLRGYPTDAGSRILEHMITEPESRDWMFVAQQVTPDQQGPIEWEGYSWDLEPRRPHIDNTVWITDSSAISYAESVMGHVADLGIGPIIGRPTAGANGNINPYRLPGGYMISWTGMKVLNRDGSQHHVIGVLPTHPMEPTIEGLREGRDELLEAALKLVRSEE